MYVHQYADKVAILNEKLKLPREVGRKVSKAPITWSEVDQKAFEAIKQKLCEGLELHIVNPDRPFLCALTPVTM